jgi:hypothetical protein
MSHRCHSRFIRLLKAYRTLVCVFLSFAWLSETMPSSAPHQQTRRTGHCADNGHFTASSKNARNCVCKTWSEKSQLGRHARKGDGVCTDSALWQTIRGEVGMVRLRGGGIYGPGQDWRNSEYYASGEQRSWPEQSNRAEYGYMPSTARNRETLDSSAGMRWDNRREPTQGNRQGNVFSGDVPDRIDPLIMDDAGRIAAQALAAVRNLVCNDKIRYLCIRIRMIRVTAA